MRDRSSICAAVLVAASLGATAAQADVVFGVALPRTGPTAAIGEQILNGVVAAAKDVNDKGGVTGQKLVLEVLDDACDPKQAVSVANRFMQGPVRVIIGHMCSGASIVASDVYAEHGALMISPASNSAKLTDRGLPGVFRVCGRDDDQAKVTAKIIAERFPGQKIAILHDNAPFGRGLAEATKANLNAIGVNEALFAAVTPGERDYAAVISRLKAAGITVAYYGGYPQEMGTLVRQSADQAFKAQWFTGSGMASKEFAAVGGPATDGVLMTFNPDPRKRQEAAAVVGAFKAQGIEPDGFTLYGYAAVQAAALAANKAQSTDPRVLDKTLKTERLDTILGNIGFDQKGDITAPGYVLYVWTDGSFDYPK
jgi:branched-chain amino acid transport system substrate-binding protein